MLGIPCRGIREKNSEISACQTGQGTGGDLGCRLLDRLRYFFQQCVTSLKPLLLVEFLEVVYLNKENDPFDVGFTAFEMGVDLNSEVTAITKTGQRVTIRILSQPFSDADLLFKHLFHLIRHTVHGLYNTSELLGSRKLLLNLILLPAEGVCLAFNSVQGFEKNP